MGPEKIEIYQVDTNVTILQLCGDKELREDTAARVLAWNVLAKRHPEEYGEILCRLTTPKSSD